MINVDPAMSISQTANKNITFDPVVNLLYTTPGAMLITTVSPPQAEVGVPYTANLMAIGGLRPYSWRITLGNLPTGLTLDPTTGVISGTPTAAGIFGFTARVDDNSAADRNTTRNFQIGVAAQGALQILTGSLPDGIQEGDYKVTLQCIGGSQPYTWSLAANKLPPGLSLDPSTGVISGTSTVPGDVTLVVAVTDSANPAVTDTQILSIHIGQQILSN